MVSILGISGSFYGVSRGENIGLNGKRNHHLKLNKNLRCFIAYLSPKACEGENISVKFSSLVEVYLSIQSVW